MSLQEYSASQLVDNYPLDVLQLIVRNGQTRLSKEIKKKIVIYLKRDSHRYLTNYLLFDFDLTMAVQEEFAGYQDFDIDDVSNIREQLINGDDAMIELISKKISPFTFPLWFTYKQSNLILKLIEQHPEYENCFLIEEVNLYQYVTFFEDYTGYGDTIMFAGYHIGSNDSLIINEGRIVHHYQVI